MSFEFEEVSTVMFFLYLKTMYNLLYVWLLTKKSDLCSLLIIHENLFLIPPVLCTATSSVFSIPFS